MSQRWDMVMSWPAWELTQLGWVPRLATHSQYAPDRAQMQNHWGALCIMGQERNRSNKSTVLQVEEQTLIARHVGVIGLLEIMCSKRDGKKPKWHVLEGHWGPWDGPCRSSVCIVFINLTGRTDRRALDTQRRLGLSNTSIFIALGSEASAWGGMHQGLLKYVPWEQVENVELSCTFYCCDWVCLLIAVWVELCCTFRCVFDSQIPIGTHRTVICGYGQEQTGR